jgi:hypothetical protein
MRDIAIKGQVAVGEGRGVDAEDLDDVSQVPEAGAGDVRVTEIDASVFAEHLVERFPLIAHGCPQELECLFHAESISDEAGVIPDDGAKLIAK